MKLNHGHKDVIIGIIITGVILVMGATVGSNMHKESIGDLKLEPTIDTIKTISQLQYELATVEEKLKFCEQVKADTIYMRDTVHCHQANP